MSALKVIGKRAWSYNTAIQDVLPDGRSIGNITKYSATTSTHQGKVGAKNADVIVSDVPQGAQNLAQWFLSRQPAPAGDFTLTITLGNDTMQTRNDVAHALELIAEELRSGTKSSPIFDDNGNTVGQFAMP